MWEVYKKQLIESAASATIITPAAAIISALVNWISDGRFWDALNSTEITVGQMVVIAFITAVLVKT